MLVAAMLSVLDDSIGNLTKTLISSGMYNNTIIIFTTDNGGPVDGFSNNYASNWPLRSDSDMVSCTTHRGTQKPVQHFPAACQVLALCIAL